MNEGAFAFLPVAIPAGILRFAQDDRIGWSFVSPAGILRLAQDDRRGRSVVNPAGILRFAQDDRIGWLFVSPAGILRLAQDDRIGWSFVSPAGILRLAQDDRQGQEENMVVRVLRFRVSKRNERKMRNFMLHDPRHLLGRSPGLRAAYFLREQGRKGQYAWITVWASDTACRRAVRSRAWQEMLRREKASGFFAARPDARHYDVVLKH